MRMRAHSRVRRRIRNRARAVECCARACVIPYLAYRAPL